MLKAYVAIRIVIRTKVYVTTCLAICTRGVSVFKFRLFKFLPTPLGFASAFDLSGQITSVRHAQQIAAPARVSLRRIQKERGRAVKFLNFNVALFFIMRAKFYAPKFCASEFLVSEFLL